jgi:DNA-nicking Smr family endonuclease
LAYAPVKALQQEYATLREEINNVTANYSKSDWLTKKQRLNELSKQLMAAKENAYNDIYERMNSCGSMGISLSGQKCTAVDLHGLSVEGAKRLIQDPIMSVLPVLKRIMVITGRGVHSQNGEGILKPAIKGYLEELQVEFEDVEGNDGAIYVIG